MTDRESRSPQLETTADPSHASALRELLLLGAILIVYVALLELAARLAQNPETVVWLQLVLPNTWLLAASLVWLRVRPLQTVGLRGGASALKMARLCVVIAALVLAAPVLWPRPGGANDASMVVQRLMLVLWVPVAEELYFRGLLLDHLVRNVGRYAAVLLVSVLFGFLHFPQGLVSTMALVSIALCVVTLGTGSVLWAVALHLGWNALAALLKMADGPGRWTVAVAAAVALGVLVMIGLRTRKGNDAQAQTGSPREAT